MPQSGASFAEINFIPKLPADVPTANAHFLGLGAPSTADCPGPEQAAASHLCVYEVVNNAANVSFTRFGDPRVGFAGIAPFGTVLGFAAGATATNNTRGSWSYTAPEQDPSATACRAPGLYRPPPWPRKTST